MIKLATLTSLAREFLWPGDVRLRGWRASLLSPLRLGFAVLEDLSTGQLNLRAMSLVYTTLLSLVPLIAVSFSVLKAFGVHNQLEPMLLEVLVPLGEKGVEVTNHIVSFVDNVRVGVLGSLGLALLFYTVISLLQKIEGAFNYTWHVLESRPLSQRFSDYLSVILVGPVLVFSALGITASVTNTAVVQALVAIEPFGTLIGFASKAVPYVLVILAFTFVYVFVPNTKVRLRSAFVGGLIAGILWETTGWVFASFVASSTNYTAIYSGFAILIMFMIWLYLSWLILLVGASIAYYHQHPQFLAIQRHRAALSNRLREQIALQVMYLIARDYYSSEKTWTKDSLAQRISVPPDALERVLEALSRSRILVHGCDDKPMFVPGRPPDKLLVKEILDVIRKAEEENYEVLARRPASDPVVGELITRIDAAVAGVLDGYTLKQLATDETPFSETPRAGE